MEYFNERYGAFESPYIHHYKNVRLTDEDRLLDNYLFELDSKKCFKLIGYDEFYNPSTTEVCSKVAKKIIEFFIDLMKHGFNIIDYSASDIYSLYKDLCTLPEYKQNIGIAKINGKPALDITKNFLKAHNAVCEEWELTNKRHLNAWKLVTARISIFNTKLSNMLANTEFSKEDINNYIKSNFEYISQVASKVYDMNAKLK